MYVVKKSTTMHFENHNQIKGGPILNPIFAYVSI